MWFIWSSTDYQHISRINLMSVNTSVKFQYSNVLFAKSAALTNILIVFGQRAHFCRHCRICSVASCPCKCFHSCVVRSALKSLTYIHVFSAFFSLKILWRSPINVIHVRRLTWNVDASRQAKLRIGLRWYCKSSHGVGDSCPTHAP